MGPATIREQWDALARTFLARFFENEITSGTDDFKSSFVWLVSFLAVPGLFIPVMMSWNWSLVALLHGPEALRAASRPDKLFYLAYSAIAAALVSTIAWHSLLPDRRDTLILGAMPVRPSTVVGAKLAALGGYIALMAAATHAMASVAFGLFLATKASLLFGVRGVLAHFIASFLTSTFVLLLVAGTQGLVLALTGPRLYARVSPILQIATVVAVILGFLALPALTMSTVDTLKQAAGGAHPTELLIPPFWFLGLYEWVLGTRDPVLLRLAGRAGVALLVSSIVTVASYHFAYRRLMASTAGETARVGRGLIRVAARLLGRAAGWQGHAAAVSDFFLATLGRAERQRFVLAIALGVSVGWAMPVYAAFSVSASPQPTAALLSLPLALIAFVLVGLRLAAAIPSDLRSSWIFDVSPPARALARRAVERTMMLVGVAPIVTLFAPIYTVLWGRTVAATHSASCVAMGFLLIQVLLWRFNGVPCTRRWNPEGLNLGRWWLLYVLAFAAFTQIVPSLEPHLFGARRASVAFLATLTLLAFALRWVTSRQRPEPDEDPGPRLNVLNLG